jgi:hypothetical protein
MSSFETNLYVNTRSGNPVVATSLNFTAPQGSVFQLTSAGGTQLRVTTALTDLFQTIPSPGSTLLLTLGTASGHATVRVSETVITKITFTSSGSQPGGTTQITVNVDGTFQVTALGTGVTFNGLYYFVTAIPTNGVVDLVYPRFLIPVVTGGASDFSFGLTFAENLSNPVATPADSSLLTVSGSTVTATSSLTAGMATTLTVSFTTEQQPSGSSTFVVQRLNDAVSPSVASGGASSLTIYGDSTVITGLAANAFLQGMGTKYETTAQGSYTLDFIATSNLGFSSTPATFPALANQPSGRPSWVQAPLLSTSPQGRPHLQIPFQSSVTTLQRTGLVINTLAGSFDDPTIVNNPDKDG